MDSIFSKSSSKRIGVYFESSDLREKKQKQRLVLLKAKHNSEMACLCIRYGSPRMLINRMKTLTSAKISLSKKITSFHRCGIILWEGSGFSKAGPYPTKGEKPPRATVWFSIEHARPRDAAYVKTSNYITFPSIERNIRDSYIQRCDGNDEILFPSWVWICSLVIQLQFGSPTFDKVSV